MKLQFSNKELFILLVVALMSFLANLPESVRGNLIDRRLLLSTLVAVTVIALFRYLRAMLLLVISILAIGANLPHDLADNLGLSQTSMVVSLAVLVAVALVNRYLHLLPVTSDLLEATGSFETADSDDVLNNNIAHARQLLLSTIAKGDIATLRILLAANAGINFTLNGTTPLHVAAEKGYSNIVQLLLDHGADYLMVNADGQTPLDVALAKKKFVRTTDILFNITMPHLNNRS